MLMYLCGGPNGPDSSFALGVGSEQQKQHHNQDQKREGGCNRKPGAGKQQAELVNHQSDAVSQYALVTDGEGRPLGAGHFTLDGADSGKTRSAQQVEG